MRNRIQSRHDLAGAEAAVRIREADMDVEVLVRLSKDASSRETREVEASGARFVLEVGWPGFGSSRCVELSRDQGWSLPAKIITLVFAEREVQVTRSTVAWAAAIEIDEMTTRR